MHDIHSKYSENETVAVQFQSTETIVTKSLRAERETKDAKRKNISLLHSFILIYFNLLQPLTWLDVILNCLAAYFDLFLSLFLSLRLVLLKSFES